MGCTVDELRDRITSKEFVYWKAMEIVDPWWVPGRNEVSSAIVASTVHNSQSRRFIPHHKFIPDWEKVALKIVSRGEAEPSEKLARDFKALTIEFGGKVITRDGIDGR